MNVDVLEAVHNVLIGDSELTDLVPANQIVFARGSLPAAYPTITLAEDLIEDGNEHNMEGLFYITIYTQDGRKDHALSAIHNVIFPLVGRQGKALDITDDNVIFHEFRQVFGDQSIHEPEPAIGTWSLQTNYTCKVTSGLGIFAKLNGSSQFFYRSDADFPESGILSDMTIQAWIKPDAGGTNDVILAKYEFATNKRMFRFLYHTQELRFGISSDGISVVERTTAGMNIEIGIWIHVAAVYDAVAGTVDFYKNGEFVEQETGFPNSIADKDPDLEIGANGGAILFDGGIRNVSLFNDKRTAGEILASFAEQNEDLSGAGNIIAQWLFNDNADVTFIDNSQGDAGRDLIPNDGGDTTFGNCGRTNGIVP